MNITKTSIQDRHLQITEDNIQDTSISQTQKSLQVMLPLDIANYKMILLLGQGEFCLKVDLVDGRFSSNGFAEQRAKAVSLFHLVCGVAEPGIILPEKAGAFRILAGDC